MLKIVLFMLKISVIYAMYISWKIERNREK
jgi:hypothetical protein